MFTYVVDLPKKLELHVQLQENHPTHFTIAFPDGGSVHFSYTGSGNGEVRVDAGLTDEKTGKRHKVSKAAGASRAESDEPTIEYSDPEM